MVLKLLGPVLDTSPCQGGLQADWAKIFQGFSLHEWRKPGFPLSGDDSGQRHMLKE